MLIFEKERSKWQGEKENMNENYCRIEEKLKMTEKERDKYKIDVEKLKAEKKSTKTHSYIGNLKTTYEPTKIYVEQTNKENSFTQQQWYQSDM